MAFKLDLGKFKKIKSDKHSTTMRHEDGHELRVAHTALTPKMRGQLAELPMVNSEDGKKAPGGPQKLADGGEAESNRPKIADTKGFGGDSGSPSNKQEAGTNKGMWSGKATQPNPTSYPNTPEYTSAAQKFNAEKLNQKAEGGEVKQYAEGDYVSGDELAQSMGAPKPASNVEDKPAAPEKAKDPLADLTRSIYNEKVNAAATQGSADVMGGFTPTDLTDTSSQTFSSSGAAPTAPNEQLYLEAKQEAAAKMQAEQAKAQQDAAAAAEKNKVRAEMGAPLIPIPQTPTGQAGAAAALTPPGQPQQPQQPQAPQAPADPYGTEATSEAFMRGLGEEKAGIFGMANAEAAQGRAEAAALQKQVENQQLEAKNYQEHYDKLEQERQHFIHDIETQRIDPNRYLGSMDTSQRVGTAIGLILGGFGSGRTGENQVLNTLNKNIDRDIDAQKAELGKKENLLSANMKQFGNLKEATEMTRAMMNDIASANFKMAAAKAMDPKAKAAALMAAGKLDRDTSSIIGQNAMRRTLLSGLKNGTASPERVVNMLIPEHQRKDANEELKDAQRMAKARDNLLSGIDKLSQLQTVASRTGSPFQSHSQIKGVEALIAGLSKETAGRFTDQDAEILRGLLPKLTDDAQTIAFKRARADKLMSEKMNFPILQTYGINPSEFGRFNAQGESRFTHGAPVRRK